MSTLSLPFSPVFCSHSPNQGHGTQFAVMEPSIGLPGSLDKNCESIADDM